MFEARVFYAPAIYSCQVEANSLCIVDIYSNGLLSCHSWAVPHSSVILSFIRRLSNRVAYIWLRNLQGMSENSDIRTRVRTRSLQFFSGVVSGVFLKWP